MRKVFRLVLLSGVLSVGHLISADRAQADSLSCQSINGQTECTGSGGLSCRTIDGRLVCAPGSSGRCDMIGDRIICRNGNVTQTFRTGPLPQDRRGGDDDPQPKPPDQGRQRNGGQWLSIRQNEHGQSLSIRQPGQELHIRTGDFDPDLD